MASKKSKAELEAELRVFKKARTTEGIVQVFLNLIKWGAIVLLARYFYLAIVALAGKITLTDITIGFLGNLKVSIALAWGFGIGGIIYGLVERKLRKDNIERLQGRIKTLEQAIDSRRSSSNLTERGDTRPEDKIQ